jgi:hypothetical protein
MPSLPPQSRRLPITRPASAGSTGGRARANGYRACRGRSASPTQSVRIHPGLRSQGACSGLASRALRHRTKARDAPACCVRGEAGTSARLCRYGRPQFFEFRALVVAPMFFSFSVLEVIRFWSSSLMHRIAFAGLRACIGAFCAFPAAALPYGRSAFPLPHAALRASSAAAGATNDASRAFLASRSAYSESPPALSRSERRWHGQRVPTQDGPARGPVWTVVYDRHALGPPVRLETRQLARDTRRSPSTMCCRVVRTRGERHRFAMLTRIYGANFWHTSPSSAVLFPCEHLLYAYPTISTLCLCHSRALYPSPLINLQGRRSAH